MKEIMNEICHQAQEIGRKEAEIKMWQEKFNCENDEYIEYLKENIKERENKIEILKKAENIILGLEVK